MKRPPKVAETAREIDLLLHDVRETLRRPLEAEFARGRLTGPQRSVMEVVVQATGISVGDLSKQVGLAHSTVCGILERLEKRGLIERRTHENDGRISQVFPSEVVQDFMRNRLPHLRLDPLTRALGRVRPAERSAILEGLRALNRALQRG